MRTRPEQGKMMYVGIDIAKEKFQACLLKDGESDQGEFENSKKGFRTFENWLKKRASSRAVSIAMEATGRYGDDLALYLHDKGYRVSVVNPVRIKAYAQSQLKRHKTDAIDAELIADFCRTQEPDAWIPPRPEERELKEMMRHLDDLKNVRQAEKNRLEAQPSSKTVQKNLREHIRYLTEKIKELEKDIDRFIDNDPKMKEQNELLTSIPGIGETTSEYILSELGDLTRFDDVRQVVAMVGLNPQQRRSGSSVHYTAGISRMGSKMLRTKLFMPAMVARKYNPILKIFGDRLAQRGLTPIQVVVAVMRKLLHLAYGVLKHKAPFNPNYLALCA